MNFLTKIYSLITKLCFGGFLTYMVGQNMIDPNQFLIGPKLKPFLSERKSTLSESNLMDEIEQSNNSTVDVVLFWPLK